MNVNFQLNPGQCRAARALLHWSQRTLAEQADVGINTIAEFESGSREPRSMTRKALCLAFNEAGIELTEKGVQLNENSDQSN